MTDQDHSPPELETPQTTPAQVANTHDSSAWKSWRAAALEHPLLSAAFALFVSMALGTLCGLPTWFAWATLVYGFAILAVIGALFAFVRQWWQSPLSSKRPKLRLKTDWFLNSSSNERPQDSEAKPQKQFSWFWNWKTQVLIWAILAARMRPNQDFSYDPTPTSHSVQTPAHKDPVIPYRVSPLFSLEGRTNLYYWQSNVAALHKFRFDQPDAEGVSTDDYFAQHIPAYKTAFINAQAASTQGVDADLLAMTKRHQAVDELEFQFYVDAQELKVELGAPANNTSLGHSIKQLQSFLEELTDEDFAKLPLKVQDILNDLVTLGNAKSVHFEEIEIMQARLIERYGGNADYFLLPDIDVQ